jgi:tetratricopeptide (TPR) repeat protein
MKKAGRNAPCPCGSGKKYKQCCLPKDEAAEHAQFKRAAEVAAADVAATTRRQQALLEQMEDEHDLTESSNAVIAMVKAGQLDEAERAARDLLVRFPDVHDGYDRLGMVYEARGQNKQAADCYRKVIEFMDAHPDQYEPEFANVFRGLVDKLDPNPDLR